MRRAYLTVTAAALCAMITFAGLNMKIFDRQATKVLVVEEGGKDHSLGIITPGIAEDSIERDINAVAPDIFKPFTKDADVNEASKALKIDIVIPAWMPEGFTKAASKLFSSVEDGSQPYMYNIEYSGPGKKMLTVSITKNMTEEEKLKAQPAPMPNNADKGAANNTAQNNAAAPDIAIDLPAIPPDAPTQSAPGANPSQSAEPPTTVEKPTPQDGNIGSSSAGNVGTGTAPSGKPVSVEFNNVKIKNVDVTLTVISSSENGAVSAFLVYNGGSYNIYTDGISKNDMFKIIESMIK